MTLATLRAVGATARIRPAMRAAEPTEPDRIGTVLGGRYRVVALIAEGGMGRVYRACNEMLGRDVALKVMLARHAASPSLVQRFVREARTANLVRHPHVVDVLDVGLDDAGAPYIVQELLDGIELSVHLWRAGGSVPPGTALALMEPVLDAVAHAHARGVVHRDLKPDNVFLVRAGDGWVPKLLDFGISKAPAVEPGERDSLLGVAIGTPAYMPPEQIRGGTEIDTRADVWSLGVMLYEMLSGRLPFRGRDDQEILANVSRGRIVPLGESLHGAPPELCRVVERCLRTDVAERYPSASELLRDVQHLMIGRRIEPTRRLALYRPIHAPDAIPSRLPEGVGRHSAPVLEWGVDGGAAETLRAAAVRVRSTHSRPTWTSALLAAAAVVVGAALAVAANAGWGERRSVEIARAVSRGGAAEVSLPLGHVGVLRAAHVVVPPNPLASNATGPATPARALTAQPSPNVGATPPARHHHHHHRRP